MLMNYIHHNGYHIKLQTAAVDDKPLLRNLMQLYLYDISEFTTEDPNRHGMFDYPYLDHYWTEQGRQEEGRLPILIQINDEVAGFALINQISHYVPRSGNTRNLAEFFIMRKWRRRSIGKVVVKEIFDTYPGHWEIKQQRENVNALQFWRNVIDEYTNHGYKEVEMNDASWNGWVQEFDNTGRL
jgi:predicted acetyltransferase